MINYLQIEMDMFLKYEDKEKAMELAKYKKEQHWTSPAFYDEIVKILKGEIKDPDYRFKNQVRLILDSYLPDKEKLTIPDIDWFRARFLEECGVDEEGLMATQQQGITTAQLREFFNKKLTRQVQIIILWEWKNVNSGNVE